MSTQIVNCEHTMQLPRYRYIHAYQSYTLNFAITGGKKLLL